MNKDVMGNRDLEPPCKLVLMGPSATADPIQAETVEQIPQVTEERLANAL